MAEPPTKNPRLPRIWDNATTPKLSADFNARQLLAPIPNSNPVQYYVMVDWSNPQLGIGTNGVYTVVPGFPNRTASLIDDHAYGTDNDGNVAWACDPDSFKGIAIAGFTTSDDPSVRFDITNRILKTPNGTHAIDFSSDTQTVLGTTIKPLHLADGSADNDSIYYSTDASKLVYKDPGGTVRALY